MGCEGEAENVNHVSCEWIEFFGFESALSMSCALTQCWGEPISVWMRRNKMGD